MKQFQQSLIGSSLASGHSGPLLPAHQPYPQQPSTAAGGAKKRGSLDVSSGSHRQQVPTHPQAPYNAPQYTSNAQKQRQISYSPFSASSKANLPQTTTQGQSIPSGSGKVSQGSGGQYNSTQQQQMMLMMQQIQKSQQAVHGGSSTSQHAQNQQPHPQAAGGTHFSLGLQQQNQHHNRSESAMSLNGAVLDRNLIDFMTSKHNNSVNMGNGATEQAMKRASGGTPQPILSAFNKKKKSQQLPVGSHVAKYGGLVAGSSGQAAKIDGGGLMGGSAAAFGQKRNSMNEAEQRRRQQMLKKQQAMMIMDDKQRPIRSANSSPQTQHRNFLVNGIAQPNNGSGLNLLQDLIPTSNQGSQQQQPFGARPGTSHIHQSNTTKNSPNRAAAVGSQGTKGLLGSQSSHAQQQMSNRPKTSIKGDQQPPSSNTSTASTRGYVQYQNPQQYQPVSHHQKSMSEDTSLKRMLKKGNAGTQSQKSSSQAGFGSGGALAKPPSSTPTTRPSSGQKKSQRTTNGGGSQSHSAQGHYDSSSSQQQQLMMMLLLQQQQSKVKSISDSHRVLPSSGGNSNSHQQKMSNFVDISLSQASLNPPASSSQGANQQSSVTQSSLQLTHQELQQLKAGGANGKTNQSTDFGSLTQNKNLIQLNSKFQSAPSTPTKNKQGEESGASLIKPQLIERNVITKYAFATRVGFIPNNPNKVNQDSFILSPNLGSCNFRHYFGVCDGHGQNGKEASHFIKMRLPQLLSKNIDDHLAEGNSHGQTKLTPCHEDYKSIFHRSFITCNEELDCQNFDVNLSGSTVCTVLFNGTKVYCGNAGDSRAIKVAFSQQEQSHVTAGGSLTRSTKKNPNLEVTALNRDHKPELKDEAERIHKRGGRIDSFRDYYNGGEPIGPQRVWLAHEEIPGLAMSRSMGDKVAHSVGVSADPETWEFTLGLNDRYMVIASDGVWEFLSNEDVANIVFPFFEQNAPEAAANALVKAAFKKWKQEEEVIDDITVVIIFLEPAMAYNSIKKQSMVSATANAGAAGASSGQGKP